MRTYQILEYFESGIGVCDSCPKSHTEMRFDILQFQFEQKYVWVGGDYIHFDIHLFLFQHEHVGLWVTGVYLVLVSPVLLLYRSLDPDRVTREQLYMAAEDAGAKERSAV